MKIQLLKKAIKKWSFRLIVSLLLIAGLLLTIVLNPVLTYAHSTAYRNFIIFHNEPLDPGLTSRLDDATDLLRKSELYDSRSKFDICLNDGSNYPTLIKKLRGEAFAWGFYNKVVLLGKANCKDNFAELNGYKWNLTQLLAHEMIHCLQYKKLGFWKSNPIAKIPVWKWEGYPEYIARQNTGQISLRQNIAYRLEVERSGANEWGIVLPDNTITPKEYYDYLLLVQYCMDIRNMTYEQLLADSGSEKLIKEKMMRWYMEKN